jgi:hypothetical protein
MQTQSNPGRVLVAIKLLHTVVWVFFVLCIVSVPIAAGLHRFALAALFAGFVLLECLVLALNRCRCPLTDVAARLAPDDAPNFDIYLPAWVAEHNKQIFGTIFVLGGLFALAEWLMSAR